MYYFDGTNEYYGTLYVIAIGYRIVFIGAKDFVCFVFTSQSLNQFS
jgi:hypothetical protein